ncbi:MAG: MraY family glycosyltransferase [Candidatus Ratteibacteria bacterium]
MWNFVYLAAFLLSLVLSLLLTPFFRKVALAGGIMDYPAARKVHQVPTPLLGGAGLLFSFLVTVLLGFIVVAFLRPLLPQGIIENLPGAFNVLPRLLIIIAGGVLIFLLGLVDDLVGLKAGWKLLGQSLIALLLFFLGLRISLFVPNFLFSMVLTVGWFLLITNSFNLLDNMDGLAAGTGLISALLFFLYAVGNGALFISTLLAVFAGAVLGFLRYNFPPAKIFLGESGSTFIGYFLAVISITVTFYYQKAPSYLPVLAPIFILAIPLFDTLSVVVIRFREGRSIFTAGRDHLSHRLLKFGLTKQESVVVIYLLALGLGLPALVLGRIPLAGGLVLLFQALLFLGILTILEKKEKT